MRIAKTLVLTAVAATAFAAPAVAAGGNSGSFTNPFSNSDDSAEFRGGTWRFGVGSGSDPWGFYYYGRLKDTKADGDWVYTRGKIDGYSWAGGDDAENHSGKAGGEKNVAQRIFAYDPPGQGKIQLCRHRGGVYPNICSESAWKYSD